ncbi:MAG: leucine-rich repeat protein, partial [Clostridia bacterium]|nr:leucine-rich repeat protein [Clostridia bacterium]
FSGCKKLTFDSLPESLECIGASAFMDCDSLETVEIPQGVRSIEDWTFANCEILTDVYIPDTVEMIEEFAFENSHNVVIHCSPGSEAERFAKEAGLPIVYDF